MKEKKLPKRIPQHEIDQEACKIVPLSFNSKNWEFREITGRDFGIDRIAERFEDEYTTSEYLLLQIKGTTKKINPKNPKFILDTPEIQYAEVFSDPVLLVYVWLDDPDTCYYVWLQEYIRARLNYDKPDWRDQDYNTIYFPPDNIIKLSEDKLKTISRYPKNKRAWLQYYLTLNGIGNELKILLEKSKAGREIGHDDFVKEIRKVYEKIIVANDCTVLYNIEIISNALKNVERQIFEILKYTNIEEHMDITNWESLIDDIESIDNLILGEAKNFDEQYVHEKYLNGDITY